MEYTDVILPWARILNFNTGAFPALGKLVSSEFSSDFYSSDWHNGRVAARWFAHQARLDQLARALIPVLKEDEDLMEAITDFDTDSADLPAALRDLMSEEELDFIRDFWEDATSEWEISGSPHEYTRSLMVRTGAFMSAADNLPYTVGGAESSAGIGAGRHSADRRLQLLLAALGEGGQIRSGRLRRPERRGRRRFR